MKGRSDFWPLAASLGIGCWVLACSAASDRRPDTVTQVADAQSQDCTALSNLPEREKCFATSDDFKNCPESDTRCAPYRTMYALDARLRALNKAIPGLAQKQYASYTKNDPDYLKDLGAYFEASDRAWQASRDADCALEPFMQGMSRPEIADLTEACHVDRTKARIDELTKLKAALNQ